jgi:hypothetical protein
MLNLGSLRVTALYQYAGGRQEPHSFCHCVFKNTMPYPLLIIFTNGNRLCVLEVTVPGYRPRGPGFDARRYWFFSVVEGLVGSLTLLRITGGYLKEKVAAPV